MEISKTEQKFALAALTVFQRYGVRKTTMEEIAAEAGVSKPTLYATFKNKDAALAASIRFAKSQAMNGVRDAWATTVDLEQKLDIFFDRMVIAGFDMLHTAPDPEAFEKAIGAASEAAVDDVRIVEHALMSEAFSDTRALEKNGLNSKRFAAFIVDAAMNAKRQATSREALVMFLGTLKQTALVASGKEPSVA